MSKKKEIKTKMTVDLEKAIAYIECLLAGLKQGTVIFEHDNGKVILLPAKNVKLEIEIEEDGQEQELEIELKWEKSAASKGAMPEILGRIYPSISGWKPA